MQRAEGEYIAQAEGGSTAIVQVFQSAAPVEVAPEELADAERLLAEMPVDDVLAPSGLPPGSHMPWRRNPVFVGREADLQALASTLKAGGRAAVGQSAAVTGLGGIGKTQLASEFAYRYGRYFAGGVFWLSFADGSAIAAEIAACGGPRALNLHPEFDSHPLNAQIGLVASVWHGELPRLLIFDNCEDDSQLEAWAPRSGGCRVLVTTRRQEWRLELGVDVVPLGVLERGESKALLCKHRPDLDEDDSDLDAIADELGDLPLALHLAGSFLARYQRAPQGTPEVYLSELRRPGLLEHRSMSLGGRSPTGHEQHVARTFALSHDQLDEEKPTDVLARASLARAAWFAPGEPIPRDLLRLSAGVEGEDGDDGLGFEDALARLAELGLLDQEQDGSLVLHRLLGAFVRSEADDATAALEAVESVVLSESIRLNQAGFPAPLLAWQPHLRAVAERAAEPQTKAGGKLLNELGCHLDMIADYAGAKAAYEHALAIVEAAYGPDHSNVATVANNLGGVLRRQGELDGAKAALERALAIDEAIYGPDHPEVATDVNSLGNVLLDHGDLEDAKAAFERALAIDEAALGPDHPKVAIRVNNLGEVLRIQGDLPGAKAAFKRALSIGEAAQGPNHPEVASFVNNLGSVLDREGDLAGAKAAFERALSIDEAAHGPDHPAVATDVNNLGQVLSKQGDLPGAKAAYERALAISEKALGPDHPTTEIIRNNLNGV